MKKNTSLLLVILFQTTKTFVLSQKSDAASDTSAPALILDTYLDNGTDEEDLQCLMRVLAKVNKDTKIDSEAINGKFQEDLHEGITQGIDVATMQLQFTHLQKEDRDAISKCELDLNQAIDRCEDVYTEDGCTKITVRKATGLKTDPDDKYLVSI